MIIASLIVLLPGMTLTNAVNELTSQHLVSGTARFAGALTTVLKLTIGTAIALTLAQLIGLQPQVRALAAAAGLGRMASRWSLAAFAFAVLFRAQRRDYSAGDAVGGAGYLMSRFGGRRLGSPAGDLPRRRW